MNKTFIIVLNFNNFDDTLECISSCQNLSEQHYEIVVVDNNSSDDSYAKLLQLENIHLLKCKENNGYASGNNLGICYAISLEAEFIWLLNNDTTVSTNCLTNLINTALCYPELTIIGTQILNYYDKTTVDFLGGKFDHLTASSHHIGRKTKFDNMSVHQKPFNTDFITGCSIFFNASVIHKIGYIPDCFFLYCEDLAWSWKAKITGIQIIVDPSAIIYHKIHSTTKKYKKSTYYDTRNKLFLLEMISHNQKVSWINRFWLDLCLITERFFSGNIRGCYNMINAYYSWIMRNCGPTDKPKKFELRDII